MSPLDVPYEPTTHLTSMTHICIYRGEPFQDASGEHILQNSMGARWQSSTIVCNEVQTLFAKTIDTALQEGLQEFRLLLGAKGGRGGSPRPIRVETTTGKPALLKPGGQAELASPIVTRSSENPQQYEIAISAKKDLGRVAAQIREHIRTSIWPRSSRCSRRKPRWR
jgi:hypothetical protein